MKVAILSGSSRSENNTHRVALALAETAKHLGADAEVVDFKRYDIPFPNGGSLHLPHLTPFQQELHDVWSHAQLVIMVTPEYNWFPSAEIINMLHQIGTHQFRHLFENKVFAFTGVSTGRGGRVPTIQLSSVMDKLIGILETHSIVCPKKFESQFTTRALDVNGKSLGNEEYDHGLTKFLEYALQLTKHWSEVH